ncbi:MAG: porin family protein [Prevotella sp.]|mgnify:FL=1|nr:porin family protein [Prevotella sp.]MDD7028224.1 porin family protein [Prevotellaceae bacterium]MCI7016685.1 porin family protein [Prevotella sp.]MDY3252461.1 porin family protein [Prevotella sp.]MDY4555684.1 porin family protein [Prevotella sp.]
MKKIFTTIVLMAAMLVAIPAKAGINFGIKGGYNITNFSFSEDVIAKDNQQGFFIGPSLKIGIPVLPIGFEIAALYDQRDAKLEGEKISQKSINIPINVRYELGLGDMAGIYVAAGPQFGFNIGDKKFSFSNANDYKMKDSNLSLNLGAGIRLVSHLEIGFNYNIALGKTGEFNEVDGAKNLVGNGKANAWQISAAYYF